MDRGGWKRLSDEAVQYVVGSTSLLTKGNKEDIYIKARLIFFMM